jgi:hypothetical protein
MYAVEFRTIIKNGIIEIPSEYRKKLKDRVRVILLAEEPPKLSGDFIGELLIAPVKMSGFQPLPREEIHAR